LFAPQAVLKKQIETEVMLHFSFVFAKAKDKQVEERKVIE